jgi:hypothetical protein
MLGFQNRPPGDGILPENRRLLAMFGLETPLIWRKGNEETR